MRREFSHLGPVERLAPRSSTGWTVHAAGCQHAVVTESDVLTTSEGMRGMMDNYAHATSTSAILERLADLHPSLLACQHGSAYRGNGDALLRELAATLERENERMSAQQPAASA